MSETFTKWELVQDNKWPFDIRIMCGDRVVIQQGRSAYSSRDKSIEDVMNAIHFPHGLERQNAEADNRMQLDALRIASAAHELLEALEEVVNNYVEISQQEGRITKWCLGEVKKAIAKARGE